MFSSNLQFSNVHISSSVHVEHPKRQMVNIQNNRHAADPTKYGNIYWTVPKWTYMNKVLWNICVRVISFAIWHGTDMYWCRGLLWSANSSYAQILAKVAVLAQKCTNQQVSLTSLIARKKMYRLSKKCHFSLLGNRPTVSYSHDQSWWEARKYVKAREIMALKLRLSAEAELFEEFFIRCISRLKEDVIRSTWWTLVWRRFAGAVPNLRDEDRSSIFQAFAE